MCPLLRFPDVRLSLPRWPDAAAAVSARALPFVAQPPSQRQFQEPRRPWPPSPSIPAACGGGDDDAPHSPRTHGRQVRFEGAFSPKTVYKMPICPRRNPLYISLVARKMSQYNKTLYRDIFLATRLLITDPKVTLQGCTELGIWNGYFIMFTNEFTL